MVEYAVGFGGYVVNGELTPFCNRTVDVFAVVFCQSEVCSFGQIAEIGEPEGCLEVIEGAAEFMVA